MAEYKFVIIDREGNRNDAELSVEELLLVINTLEPRDLHILDPKFNFKISSITKKSKTIFIKLDYIKCIIFKQTAYVVYEDSKESIIIDFDIEDFCQDLCLTLQNKDNKLKPKFKILDEIFVNVAENFEKNVTDIAPTVTEIKSNLSEKNSNVITSKRFIDLKSRLINLKLRIKDIYDLLEGIVPDLEHDNKVLDDDTNEDDEVIGAKQPTFKDILTNHKVRFEESYKNIKEMLAIVDAMLEISQTVLADKRNQMAKFMIDLTLVSIGISFSSLIAAAFGMNVPNGMEDFNFAFLIIGIAIILIIFVSFMTLYFVKRKF